MSDKIQFGWLIILSLGVIISWMLPFAKDKIKKMKGE